MLDLGARFIITKKAFLKFLQVEKNQYLTRFLTAKSDMKTEPSIA
jgi:hypothetical protein